jgi:hypothetical protein
VLPYAAQMENHAARFSTAHVPGFVEVATTVAESKPGAPEYYIANGFVDAMVRPLPPCAMSHELSTMGDAP